MFIAPRFLLLFSWPFGSSAPILSTGRTRSKPYFIAIGTVQQTAFIKFGF